MVQGVQKWFSFQTGCGIQNELRTAALDHYGGFKQSWVAPEKQKVVCFYGDK